MEAYVVMHYWRWSVDWICAAYLLKAGWRPAASALRFRGGGATTEAQGSWVQVQPPCAINHIFDTPRASSTGIRTAQRLAWNTWQLIRSSFVTSRYGKYFLAHRSVEDVCECPL